MKKIISALLCVLILASGCSNVQNASDDTQNVDSEKEYVKFSMDFLKIESLEGVLGLCDCYVLAKVNSRGESYLRSGEFDPNRTDKSVSQQLMSIQTPYEIEILEVYMGDLEVGSTVTAAAAHGEIADYIVDFGLPELEVGEIYLMPLDHTYGDDELGIVTSSSVKVSQIETLSTDSAQTATLTPLMRTAPYDGLETLQDFETKIAEILNSKN